MGQQHHHHHEMAFHLEDVGLQDIIWNRHLSAPSGARTGWLTGSLEERLAHLPSLDPTGAATNIGVDRTGKSQLVISSSHQHITDSCGSTDRDYGPIEDQLRDIHAHLGNPATVVGTMQPDLKWAVKQR